MYFSIRAWPDVDCNSASCLSVSLKSSTMDKPAPKIDVNSDRIHILQQTMFVLSYYDLKT